MDRRRGHGAAVATAAVVALVAALVPFTTGGALPADGELDANDSQSTEETDDSGATGDTASLDGGDLEGSTEGTVSELESAVDEVEGTASETVEETTTSSSSSTTTTTAPPDDGTEETDEPGEERDGEDGERSSDPADQESSDGGSDDEATDDESDGDRSERVEAVLHRLRAFDDPPSTSTQTAAVQPPAAETPAPLIDFVDVPSGPRSTRDLVDALDAAGASAEQIAEILAPFPVAGPARYSNDWAAPRHGPGPILRQHEGTDVFAPRGTPVVAAAGGVITRVGRDTDIGGNSVRVTTTDGGYFYYSHLEGFADGIHRGVAVDVGDVLGSVGTTGNAEGTPPHLHFEIHPTGGEAVPPLPYLDRWLEEARTQVEAFTGSGGGERVVVAAEPTGVGGGTSSASVFAQPAATAAPTRDQAPAIAGWLLIAGVLAAVLLRKRNVLERLRRRLPVRIPVPRARRRARRSAPDVLEALVANDAQRRAIARSAPTALTASSAPSDPARGQHTSEVLVGAGHERDNG